MKDFVPVNEPLLSKEAKDNVNKALQSGWISSSGSFVKEFEEEFAKFVGVKYGVAVSSGTAALHVALLSLGIGEGDEVIVPAFTMAASWLAVLHAGAKPIFVDCEADTFNIDPNLIERKITKKTRAIMPVHIYGHPCEMDPIMKLARKHKLKVVEDAAEAHSGEYKGKKCGSFGDVGCFSFYANKIITTGEGGMVVTDNKKIADEARKFRDLYHSDKKRFIHEKTGYNYRMTNLQAAVGLGELNHIKEYTSRKQKMAKLYKKYLKDTPGINLPLTKKYVKNVYWMYAITVSKKNFGINKDELRRELQKEGIDTRGFFYAPEDQPVLKTYLKNKDTFPNTKKAASTGLYLPSGLAITESQIKRVASSIKKIRRRFASA